MSADAGDIRNIPNREERWHRSRMPVAQRAKQFAPFKAVGGLDEALRIKEEEHRKMLDLGSSEE